MSKKVICIHIGARAHYLLPKALNLNNSLEALITDTWVSSGVIRSLLNNFPLRIIKSFANRYSAAIPSGLVYSFSIRFLLIEFYIRFKYKGAWEQIIQRNKFFEKGAINIFKKFPNDYIILGISYTSLYIFKLAASRKQKTILFQIDPGYMEEEIVARVVDQHKNVYTTTWKRAPHAYWDNWKLECELSDVIMVNSEWSKTGLIAYGVSGEKIKILPLPFQLESKHTNFEKNYPHSFTTERPLRLLFLGTLTLRKGIHLVLEAAASLIKFPLEFILVGESELDSALLEAPNVKYKGVATRVETDTYYKEADVFLFPTLSDGFGLTQLEAMSWQLPVIASTCCGDVVINNFNGMVLNNCNAEELIKTILECFNNSSKLKYLSSNGIGTVKKFNINDFSKKLIELV